MRRPETLLMCSITTYIFFPCLHFLASWIKGGGEGKGKGGFYGKEKKRKKKEKKTTSPLPSGTFLDLRLHFPTRRRGRKGGGGGGFKKGKKGGKEKHRRELLTGVVPLSLLELGRREEKEPRKKGGGKKEWVENTRASTPLFPLLSQVGGEGRTYKEKGRKSRRLFFFRDMPDSREGKRGGGGEGRFLGRGMDGRNDAR